MPGLHLRAPDAVRVGLGSRGNRTATVSTLAIRQHQKENNLNRFSSYQQGIQLTSQIGSLFETFAKHNMLIPTLPSPLPVRQLKEAGIHDILGAVKVEDFTYFHNLIYSDEMIRNGMSGPGASMTTGIAFGLPPVIKFGSPQLQQRFLPDAFHGKTRFCIAITEPDAGSDVANIKTTAKKSADGKKYVINGTKKWITNGIWSDYASMAVRTGGEGPGGLSLMVVPLKNYPGVEMRRLKVSGQVSAGTTFIELDDVEVPVENLIGEEGMGMRYIM